MRLRLVNLQVLDVLIPQLSSTWKPPASNHIKINVDTAAFPDLAICGLGVVARDKLGQVLYAKARYPHGCFSPQLAELYAASEGVLDARASQWQHWTLETDASKAIQSISSPSPFSTEAVLVEDFRLACKQALLNPEDVLHHRPRSENRVAHVSAVLSLRKMGAIFTKNTTETYICKLLPSTISYLL